MIKNGYKKAKCEKASLKSIKGEKARRRGAVPAEPLGDRLRLSRHARLSSLGFMLPILSFLQEFLNRVIFKERLRQRIRTLSLPIESAFLQNFLLLFFSGLRSLLSFIFTFDAYDHRSCD